MTKSSPVSINFRRVAEGLAVLLPFIRWLFDDKSAHKRSDPPTNKEEDREKTDHARQGDTNTS